MLSTAVLLCSLATTSALPFVQANHTCVDSGCRNVVDPCLDVDSGEVSGFTPAPPCLLSLLLLTQRVRPACVLHLRLLLREVPPAH